MASEAVSKIAGEAGASAVRAAIRRAGETTGASFELLFNMAKRESSLNPAAKAATSSAAGLFQFIEQTWLGAVKNHGAKHGLGQAAAAIEKTAAGRYAIADPERRREILDLRFDPAHAAALAGELAQDNRKALETRLGRPVTSAELYAAHFLGAAGAARLLAAAPDASAADLLPAAAAANKPVFYANGRARSVGEVVASIEKSMGLADAGALASVARDMAPERKSATFASFPSALATPDGFETPLRPEALLKSSQGEGDTRALATLFAQREPPAQATLSPLALAVLQALDPTRIRATDDDRTAARR